MLLLPSVHLSFADNMFLHNKCRMCFSYRGTLRMRRLDPRLPSSIFGSRTLPNSERAPNTRWRDNKMSACMSKYVHPSLRTKDLSSAERPGLRRRQRTCFFFTNGMEGGNASGHRGQGSVQIIFSKPDLTNGLKICNNRAGVQEPVFWKAH
jgi:hypothetical protein